VPYFCRVRNTANNYPPLTPSVAPAPNGNISPLAAPAASATCNPPLSGSQSKEGDQPNYWLQGGPSPLSHSHGIIRILQPLIDMFSFLRRPYNRGKGDAGGVVPAPPSGFSSFTGRRWGRCSVPFASSSSDSLRSQLLMSFGISAFVSLGLVVLLAIVAACVAARTVNGPAVNQIMTEQVNRTLVLSAQMVGDTFDAYLMDLEGTLQILVEAVQDRIVGYPSEPGWETDAYVPFLDMDTDQNPGQPQRRAYPLKVPPPPLDWERSHNINPQNAREHLQERVDLVSEAYLFHSSTASASYFMQGTCNPDITDPTADAYYPNCTADNNNVTTGGVVRPTKTNYELWRRSGDLGVFLKPLFESQSDALYFMVAFFNEGAGSVLSFPGSPINGTWEPYESTGCEWMNEINMHTGRPFGTQDMIDNCRPKGTKVPYRLFNAMEQGWCERLALSYDPNHRRSHSGRIQWFGPLLVRGVRDPVMLVGKSIFDQLYVTCRSGII
jgi:hypothetical protein